MAELCGATVHVLYVVDETAYAAIPNNTRQRVREAFEGDGQSATKAIAEQALDRNLTVHREVRWGDPAVAIIAYIVENDIDLIVKGTTVSEDRLVLGRIYLDSW